MTNIKNCLYLNYINLVFFSVQQCPSLEGAENPGEPIYLTVCNYGNAGNWVEGSDQKPYVADPHGWSWYNLLNTLRRIVPAKDD